MCFLQRFGSLWQVRNRPPNGHGENIRFVDAGASDIHVPADDSLFDAPPFPEYDSRRVDKWAPCLIPALPD